MPNWFRKTLVALITVFTFGLVTPPSILLDNAKAADKPTSTAGQQNLESTSYTYEETNDRLTTDTFITYAMQEAEKQSMQKFGTKIGPVIEDEFKDVILPKIEEAIAELANDVPEESLQSLAISQNQRVEIMKRFFTFTIRKQEMTYAFPRKRYHPPQDGYYFNFHYHRFDDGYSGHHELGNIYWNTNVPPKWLS